MKNISINLRRILREDTIESGKGTNKESVLGLLKKVLEDVKAIKQEDGPEFAEAVAALSNIDPVNDTDGNPVSFNIVLMDRDVITAAKEKLKTLTAKEGEAPPSAEGSPSSAPKTADPSETQPEMSEEEKEIEEKEIEDEFARIKSIADPAEKARAREALEKKMAARAPANKEVPEGADAKHAENMEASEKERENYQVAQALARNRGKNRELTDEEISGDDPRVARRARERVAQGTPPEKEDKGLENTVPKIKPGGGNNFDWKNLPKIEDPKVKAESKKLNRLKRLIREVALNEARRSKR
jgi:hypothetical protein